MRSTSSFPRRAHSDHPSAFRPKVLSRGTASESPEEWLRRSMDAERPSQKLGFARHGLAGAKALDPLTQVLLLRQVCIALLHSGRFDRAARVADQMATVGPLRDLGHHEAARARFAAGNRNGAIEAQTAAYACAPTDRRSFHGFCLANYLHFDGRFSEALSVLARARRFARRDLPLHDAYAAYLRLEQGELVANLHAIVRDLERAPCREGYGHYVLGMLAWHLGDQHRAFVHLRAFLRRNASADKVKAATLFEEFRRARSVLASFTSN